MKTLSLYLLVLLLLATGCSKEGGTSTTQPAAWKTLASMSTARHHFGFVVCNNLLYAIGGYNADGLNKVEVYDPASNTWQTRAPMPTARGYLVVATVGNKIYAIGGITGPDLNNITYINSTEEYDPASDKWVTKAPIPLTIHAPNSVLGNEFITGATINGKIYVIVGYSNGSVPAYVYDPSTDSWSTGKTIGKFNLRPYFSTVTGSDCYVNNGDNFLKYSSPSDEWSTLQFVVTSVYGTCLASDANNIYAMGGYSTILNSVVNYNDFAIYDIGKETWNDNAPSMNVARHSAAAVTFNGNLYVAGGASLQGNYTDVPLSSLEVYPLK